MEALEISLNGIVVGYLERNDDENNQFTFDTGWFPATSPVLGQFFNDRYPRALVTTGLPCWFEHLLPQGAFRQFVAKSAKVEEFDGFALLAAWGDDLPGAVLARPTQPRAKSLQGVITTTPAATSPPFRFALAGAQIKLSLRGGDGGFTVPVVGQSGSWIAKFADPRFPTLPRVEYATMTWAAAAGLTVPDIRLLKATSIAAAPEVFSKAGEDVFCIRRFDRTTDGARVHMEDFAQILDRPPGDPQYNGSHEEIAAILACLCPGDIEEFVRRTVFNLLCGNGDAHLKNWTVQYPDGRTASLSPLYDVVATVVYGRSLAKESALSLMDSRDYSQMSRSSFHGVAKAAQITTHQVDGWVKSSVAATIDAWNSIKSSLTLTKPESNKIESHLKSMSLT